MTSPGWAFQQVDPKGPGGGWLRHQGGGRRPHVSPSGRPSWKWGCCKEDDQCPPLPGVDCRALGKRSDQHLSRMQRERNKSMSSACSFETAIYFLIKSIEEIHFSVKGCENYPKIQVYLWNSHPFIFVWTWWTTNEQKIKSGTKNGPRNK